MPGWEPGTYDDETRRAAEATLEQALEAAEAYATGHFLLGSLLAGRGEFDRAVPHLERAVALEPDGPLAARARRALAAARARQGSD